LLRAHAGDLDAQLRAGGERKHGQRSADGTAGDAVIGVSDSFHSEGRRRV
jgi:hypothetical protein